MPNSLFASARVMYADLRVDQSTSPVQRLYTAVLNCQLLEVGLCPLVSHRTIPVFTGVNCFHMERLATCTMSLCPGL